MHFTERVREQGLGRGMLPDKLVLRERAHPVPVKLPCCVLLLTEIDLNLVPIFRWRSTGKRETSHQGSIRPARLVQSSKADQRDGKSFDYLLAFERAEIEAERERERDFRGWSEG